MVDLLKEIRPDAVEVHTAPGRGEALSQTSYRAFLPQGSPAAPGGELRTGRTRSHSSRSEPRAWLRHACILGVIGFCPFGSLDGRPMRGDLGAGTARAAVQLGAGRFRSRLTPPARWRNQCRNPGAP